MLLHFGLVICFISFLEKPVSWFSDPVDVTMGPKTNYIWLWRHQITSSHSRKNPESSRGIIFLLSSQNLGIRFVGVILKKARAETSCRSVLQTLRKLGYVINIFQKIWDGHFVISIQWKSWIWDQDLPKTWNGNLVIWDQYLSESMKWKFGNMWSMSIKNMQLGFGNMGQISFEKTWNCHLINSIEWT